MQYQFELLQSELLPHVQPLLVAFYDKEGILSTYSTPGPLGESSLAFYYYYPKGEINEVLQFMKVYVL